MYDLFSKAISLNADAYFEVELIFIVQGSSRNILAVTLFHKSITLSVPHYFITFISKGAGFNFDNTPVKNEETKLNGVFTEYLAPIGSGFSDYDTAFPKALERLKSAGIDKYIAEYQKQFSEWYAKQQ